MVQWILVTKILHTLAVDWWHWMNISLDYCRKMRYTSLRLDPFVAMTETVMSRYFLKVSPQILNDTSYHESLYHQIKIIVCYYEKLYLLFNMSIQLLCAEVFLLDNRHNKFIQFEHWITQILCVVAFLFYFNIRWFLIK